MVLYTHTHTHTHTCISLKEEKRVDSSYVNFLKVLMALVRVQILNIVKNLIDRLLFSKQNYLLPKSKFLFFKKIQLGLKNFFKKINIQKRVFEEITISRLNQFVC